MDTLDHFSSNLRRNSIGYQAPWTPEQLTAGLMQFKEMYGKFPTAHDVDAFDYLPSSRSIQRNYGGLVHLRKTLIPNETADYTRGSSRSDVARSAIKNGQEYESLFYTLLSGYFSEIAVHEHKVMRPGNVNCDFYIYITKNSGVVIDIFYSSSVRNLTNIINIKLKRYILVNEPTYLIVVGNSEITQIDIDSKMKNRKEPLPSHIQVISEAFFVQNVIPDLMARSEYSLR